MRTFMSEVDRAGREWIVRINRLSGEWGTEDFLAARGAMPDAILLPKVDGPADIRMAEEALEQTDAPDGLALWAMVETPRGMLELPAIAARARNSLRAAGLPRRRHQRPRQGNGAQARAGRANLVPWLSRWCWPRGPATSTCSTACRTIFAISKPLRPNAVRARTGLRRQDADPSGPDRGGARRLLAVGRGSGRGRGIVAAFAGPATRARASSSSTDAWSKGCIWNRRAAAWQGPGEETRNETLSLPHRPRRCQLLPQGDGGLNKGWQLHGSPAMLADPATSRCAAARPWSRR
jgi:hypothetical protein